MGVWVSCMTIHISLSKPRIDSKMTKSPFQIPHHVAIQILAYALPRRKSSQNIGASGDGFPARPVATICEEAQAFSQFVWANSVTVCFPIVTLDGPNHL